jgi:hypothetical protein
MDFSRIVFLNTSILTCDGVFSMRTVTLDEVKALPGTIERLSAIGHASTAEILTEMLGEKIEVNRIEYKQQAGDLAVVFKLAARAPEGVILNREQIETIGYEFKFLMLEHRTQEIQETIEDLRRRIAHKFGLLSSEKKEIANDILTMIQNEEANNGKLN